MAKIAANGRASPAVIAASATGLAVALAVSALLAWKLPAIAAGQVVELSYPWLPALGVHFALRIDGLGLLFALLISAIGALILIYSHRYMRGHPHAARMQVLLTLFMISMLGLVLADDVITLFVFWELTTVVSYLLIGFESASAQARRAALQAVLVTGIGGLAMLVGLLMLSDAGGGLRISVWNDGTLALDAHPHYAAILVLVLLGAFTKSAQFPFHFWLPNAMAAPTPVSAYLHSATMVKAGVYLLARLQPTLGGTEAWFLALTTAGAVTAVWAAVQSLRQDDLKLALAHTTVVALGTLVLFLGSDEVIAATAAMTFLVVHALYKCGLFLVVGIVDHESGTRLASRLGGLGPAMPLTAAAAALAALSMAGIPPFLGFVGKELQYEGALALHWAPLWVTAALIVANALVIAIAAKVAFAPFWRGRADTPRTPHDAPWSMLAAPALLALLGLALGLAPGLAGRVLVDPSVIAIRARPETLALHLWHGLNLPLLLSVLTVALGVLLYSLRTRLSHGLASAAARLPMTGDRGYDASVAGLQAVARWQTDLLQSGSLRRYLGVTFATLSLAVGGTLLWRGGAAWPSTTEAVPPVAWAVVLLIVLATAVPIFTASRLASITALGVVGAGVALLFLLFGAPDVAMTQFLVEVLFVVLVALVLLRLPRLRGSGAPPVGGRGGAAVLALATGATVTAVLLAVLSAPLDLSLQAWFTAESVPSGHGHNIVNVILVDFRALDTLGEITVLATAALAGYALVKLRAERRGSGGAPEPEP
jgi:multicomponent Na+:H+ antiporter subunit A